MAIALHIGVVGLYIWVTHNQQWEELLPPLSVVMEISIESQAEQLTEANIGQLQELSVANQAHEAPSEEKTIPPLAINEQAEVQVAKAVSTKRTAEVKKKSMKSRRLNKNKRLIQKPMMPLSPVMLQRHYKLKKLPQNLIASHNR